MERSECALKIITCINSKEVPLYPKRWPGYIIVLGLTQQYPVPLASHHARIMAIFCAIRLLISVSACNSLTR